MPGPLPDPGQAGTGLADEIIDHPGTTQAEARHGGFQIHPQGGVAQTGRQAIQHRSGDAHDQCGDL